MDIAAIKAVDSGMGDVVKELEAELAAEKARLEAARAARVAKAESPEARARAARIELDDLRRQGEAEAREEEDEQAWQEARAKHGVRCGRVFTGAGWLILRANTAAEWDSIQARAENLASTALSEGDATRASADTTKAYREGLITKSIVWPEDVKRRREITDEWHGVWPELYAMRDELNRGPRVAAGKGDAR